MEAQEISKLFETYGDFFLFKDTPTSIYMEFFYVDKKVVQSGKIADLLAALV